MNSSNPAHSTKNQSGILALLILLVPGVLARGLFFVSLPRPTISLFESMPLTRLWYFNALQNHLLEYLYFATFKPPLNYIIQAALLKMFGTQAVYTHNLLMLLTFVLELSGIALLYQSSLILGASRWISAVLLAGYSIYLMPFEAWMGGGHYDHYTLFFDSLFIFSLLKYRQHATRGRLACVSIAGALFALQSTIGTFVVPVGVIAFLPFQQDMSWTSVKRCLIQGMSGCLGMLLVVITLKVKNAAQGIGPVISNAGGQNLMLVVYNAFGFSEQKVREAIVTANPPEWYLWCFDHSTTPDGTYSEPYLSFSRSRGLCFPFTTPESGSWPFDFQSLMHYLKDTHQEAQLDVVARDDDDARHRPYLFSGFAAKTSSRWIGVYGAVSEKIARHLLFTQPKKMLTAFRQQHGVFRTKGPFFPRTVLKGTLDFPSMRRYVTLYGFLLKMAYHAVFIGWLAAGCIAVRRLWSGRALTGWEYWWTTYGALSAPMLITALMFSCLSFAENDRYFMQVIPYIVLMSSIALSRLCSDKRL